MLVLAALAALGAIVAVRELLGQLDRLNMAATTADDIGRLPATTDEPESDL